MARANPRNAAKEIVEGVWVQERLYDIGGSDDKKCRECDKEEKHRLHLCLCLEGGLIPDWRKTGHREQRDGTKVGI